MPCKLIRKGPPILRSFSTMKNCLLFNYLIVKEKKGHASHGAWRYCVIEKSRFLFTLGIKVEDRDVRILKQLFLILLRLNFSLMFEFTSSTIC